MYDWHFEPDAADISASNGYSAGDRWRARCDYCGACIDPGYAQQRIDVALLWNRRTERSQQLISLHDCEIEKIGETRTFYTFYGLTPRGETVIVGMTACYPDNSSKNSLPNLWHKRGFTPSVLTSYWAVDVYSTQPDGRCFSRYNPTMKPRQDGPGAVLDFAWMLPATAENRDKLLAEIVRRANAGE